MARQKCVRTLILACSIALLASAIAAFRLRDDETDAKSTNSPVNAKCDACDGARTKNRGDISVSLSTKASLSRLVPSPRKAPDDDGPHLPKQTASVNQRYKLNVKSLTQKSKLKDSDDSDNDIDDDFTFGKIDKRKPDRKVNLVSLKSLEANTVVTRATKRSHDNRDNSYNKDQNVAQLKDKHLLNVNQLKKYIKSKRIIYSSDDDTDESQIESDNNDDSVFSDENIDGDETNDDDDITDSEDNADNEDDDDSEDDDDNLEDDDSDEVNGSDDVNDSDDVNGGDGYYGNDSNDDDDESNNVDSSTDDDDHDSNNDEGIAYGNNDYIKSDYKDINEDDDIEEYNIDLKRDGDDINGFESEKESVRIVNVDKGKIFHKSEENSLSKITKLELSDSDDDEDKYGNNKKESIIRNSILVTVPAIKPTLLVKKQFTSSTIKNTALSDDDSDDDMDFSVKGIYKKNELLNKTPKRDEIRRSARLTFDDDSEDDDDSDHDITIDSVIQKTLILSKTDNLPNDLKKTVDENRTHKPLVHSKIVQLSVDNNQKEVKSEEFFYLKKDKENNYTKNNIEEFIKQIESLPRKKQVELQRRNVKNEKIKDGTVKIPVIKPPEQILHKKKDSDSKLKQDAKPNVVSNTGFIDHNIRKDLRSESVKISNEVEKEKIKIPFKVEPNKDTEEFKKKNLKIDLKPKPVVNDAKAVKKNLKIEPKPITISEQDPVKHVKKTKQVEKIIDPNIKAKVSKITERKENQHQTRDALLRKTILESNFEDFYTFLPTFAPNYSRIHNPECRRHGQILMRQLHGNKLWAFQMIDASAKVPSGLLRGNGNQLGDFDECLDARARVRLDSGAMVKVKGRYCLAYVDFSATRDELRLPVHLLRGRDFIRSSNSDAGYFIPRFTSLRWGVCMPAACDAHDAEFAVRDALRHYEATTALDVSVRVEDIDCHVRKDADPYRALSDISTVVSLIGITLIVIASITATVRDLWKTRKACDSNDEDSEINGLEENSNEKNKEENSDDHQEEPQEQAESFLWTFSVQHSLRKLTALVGDDDIGCVYGIRALCGLALYVSHKVISLGMTPYVNRIELTELANSPFSVAFRNAVLYTDTYLLLSGLLASYHLAGALIKKGDMSWFKRFISRYIRLTPAMAAVIGSTILLEYLGDGPQWGIVKENAKLCGENAWRNLLYIQNFYEFEDMCAPQTHHLALDMQLTLLAAPLVWLMMNRTSFAAVAVASLHALSAWARYSASIEHNLSIVVYHGATTKQLLRTANFSYSQPLHRATPYLAGVTLGVLLRHYGKGVQLSKLVLIPGWLLCIYFGAWSFYAPSHMVYRDYQYEATEMAIYACLASIAWALCLSWVIFVCFTENAERINVFLSWHPLVILSRLTFCMYLCQFLVFFYNVGSTRTASEFMILSAINIPEIAAVIVVSLIYALLFDVPVQSLKNCVSSWQFSSNKSEAIEVDENEEDKRQAESDQQITEQFDINNTTETIESVYETEEAINSEDQIRDDYEDEDYVPQDVLIDEDDIILEEEEEEDEEQNEDDVEPADTSAGEGNNFSADLRYWRQRYTSNYEQENDDDDENDELQDWEWTANEDRTKR